jgi:hypothetical protein
VGLGHTQFGQQQGHQFGFHAGAAVSCTVVVLVVAPAGELGCPGTFGFRRVLKGFSGKPGWLSIVLYKGSDKGCRCSPPGG